MTALATLADLKSYGIDVTDEQTALSLLDSVSDAVRSAAGCPITLGEWTVDLPGEQSRKLDLPCKAVRSVSKVLIDGQPVEDWRFFGSSLYRDEPWSPFGGIPSTITVTFTGGWKPVPAVGDPPRRARESRPRPILSDSSARMSQPDSISSRTAAPAPTPASATSASTTHRSDTRKATPPKST